MRLLLVVLAVLVSGPVLAQNLPDWAAPSAPVPVQEDAVMPPEPPVTPAPVPLDGGLSLLALAGAGLAAHALRRRSDA